VKKYVERLKGALDELRASYPELLSRMKNDLSECLNRPGRFEALRADLAQAATKMLFVINDPRLKGFALRLADKALAEQEWLESLGSFVCSKPPSKWLDADAVAFRDGLNVLARQFLRVESMAFSEVVGDEDTVALRVSITRQDGAEVDQVLHLDNSELARINRLESKIMRLIGKEQRLGVIAATRAVWAQLQNSSGETG
jgi:hypothetical protein